MKIPGARNFLVDHHKGAMKTGEEPLEDMRIGEVQVSMIVEEVLVVVKVRVSRVMGLR